MLICVSANRMPFCVYSIFVIKNFSHFNLARRPVLCPPKVQEQNTRDKNESKLKWHLIYKIVVILAVFGLYFLGNETIVWSYAVRINNCIVSGLLPSYSRYQCELRMGTAMRQQVGRFVTKNVCARDRLHRYSTFYRALFIGNHAPSARYFTTADSGGAKKKTVYSLQYRWQSLLDSIWLIGH